MMVPLEVVPLSSSSERSKVKVEKRDWLATVILTERLSLKPQIPATPPKVDRGTGDTTVSGREERRGWGVYGLGNAGRL